MNFTNEETRRQAEDFKEELHRLMEAHNISDKELSSIFGVSLQSISRYKNQLDESNLPAFMLKMLPKESKYCNFQRDLIQHLSRNGKYMIVRKLNIPTIDGSLKDEIIQAVRELGELAKYDKIESKKLSELRRHATILLEAGYGMLEEINSKGNQSV